jgi:hypothetical protein
MRSIFIALTMRRCIEASVENFCTGRLVCRSRRTGIDQKRANRPSLIRSASCVARLRRGCRDDIRTAQRTWNEIFAGTRRHRVYPMSAALSPQVGRGRLAIAIAHDADAEAA